MAKQQSNTVIKFLIIAFLIFFAGVAGYEYFQYGSIFNNAEHYRKIYKTAMEQKENEEYSQAFSTLMTISPRYEAYDAVLFLQAQCAAKTGDEASVQKNLKALISKYPGSYLYLQAKYDLAKSYLRSKNIDLAKGEFENIINAHKDTDFETGSYYYLAEMYSQKDKETAIKYWKKYISQSSDGRFSQDCVNNLITNKANLSNDERYNIGLVYYNAQKFSEAIFFLKDISISKSWYYLAKSYQAVNNYKNAKDIIRQGLQNYSTSSDLQQVENAMYAYAAMSASKSLAWDELTDIVLAQKNIEDIALYNKANYLDKGRALVLYKKIMDNHLKGNYSSEALWQLIWNAYQNKNYEEAKQYALKHLNNFTNTKSAPKVNFWLGKIYEKEHNKDMAKKIYTRILNKYPDDYYAFRAFGRLNELDGGKDPKWSANKKNRIENIDFELELPYSYSEIKNKFTATTAELLLVEDFDTIDIFHDFKEPFIESWILYRKGLKSKAATTARDAVEEMNDKPVRTDKRWHFVYPVYFGELINKYSARNSLDAYLLLALIREESYFNNLALSSSNAVGLMQLMPSTAREIALNNGFGQINEFLLFNPETNIKYGTRYLKQLRNQLDNKPMLEVCAYNGGAGSVNKWAKSLTYEDGDEFIENIPYPETQNYVKKVFRSYWNYMRIYAN
ncbi:MAG: transglycosylase SLT domain-containing protein [Candidatus Gastranaerophilales bacterium]|nr:transglycosylase SLT domain-containing protein [Candidatus Gastranaerophilales bacterium]